MLNAEHKLERAPGNEIRRKGQWLHIRDLTPRRDSKGGGTPKSSPVPLAIPPKGFIISGDQ